jgi:hypothetical protein
MQAAEIARFVIGVALQAPLVTAAGLVGVNLR